MTTTIEQQNLEAIRALSLDELTINTRYRDHPELCQTDHERLFRYDLSSAIESGGICSITSSENKAVAACAIKPLSWDTRHFGHPMAKLTLAAAPECNPDSVLQLLETAITSMNKDKPHLHISCEVDIDDYNCLTPLLNLGAIILDIKREYRWTSFKGIKPPKFLSQIRDYRPEDKTRVMRILQQSDFKSRFTRDALLSPRKTAELYQIWLEKLLDGKEDDRIALVAERNGEVQACGTIEKHDLSHAGVNINMMSGGIYVSTPEARGSYYPIIYSLTEKASLICKTSQTCVSLNNHSAIRVLERMNFGTRSTRYALRLVR